MRILLPKALRLCNRQYGPLFFLAGPVRGGGDWQAKCCQIIRDRIPQFYAALPCRYPDEHPLVQNKVRNDYVDTFDRQLDWERHYLEYAGTIGCIIFWLPVESQTDPRTGNDPYAMDTRGELGEWRGRMIANSDLRVVIGAEPNFPGLSQIHRNFCSATGRKFPIYGTLADTVDAAIAKVR